MAGDSCDYPWHGYMYKNLYAALVSLGVFKRANAQRGPRYRQSTSYKNMPTRMYVCRIYIAPASPSEINADGTSLRFRECFVEINRISNRRREKKKKRKKRTRKYVPLSLPTEVGLNYFASR